MQLIWPPGASDGSVHHVEKGVVYTFDLSRNMFASGNGTERDAQESHQRDALETFHSESLGKCIKLTAQRKS